MPQSSILMPRLDRYYRFQIRNHLKYSCLHPVFSLKRSPARFVNPGTSLETHHYSPLKVKTSLFVYTRCGASTVFKVFIPKMLRRLTDGYRILFDKLTFFSEVVSVHGNE